VKIQLPTRKKDPSVFRVLHVRKTLNVQLCAKKQRKHWIDWIQMNFIGSIQGQRKQERGKSVVISPSSVLAPTRRLCVLIRLTWKRQWNDEKLTWRRRKRGMIVFTYNVTYFPTSKRNLAAINPIIARVMDTSWSNQWLWFWVEL